VCDSSFFLLCSLLSLIVVHYAHDCLDTDQTEGQAGRQSRNTHTHAYVHAHVHETKAIHKTTCMAGGGDVMMDSTSEIQR